MIAVQIATLAGGGGPPVLVREVAIQKLEQATSTDYSDAAYLLSKAEVQSYLFLKFDVIRPEYRGLIHVLPYFVTQGNPKLIDGGIFLINYEEDLASAIARFSLWLDRVIVNGLNMWRLTL